ncbi:hypothetical protein [Planococcus lenghuensis]|uniref:Uncharacterized protein n=1 Tax=Planococcus lenghuensis TaxID=2213202 RepID=A0A1Q2KYK1_9BACL|nr:hypothetical protein [Planococcus lenghuensis]AQQ53269.1 hypothetical protein B0X71_09375 [Planococcus lenghuensis]
MSRSNKPDELFKELKNVERSPQARADTLARLQRRIAHRNRRHFVPVFMTGILVLAGILFLTLTLTDNGYPGTGTMGEDGEDVHFDFIGSGDGWTVEYEVTHTEDDDGRVRESWRYILTYQGFDRPVEIDYEIRLPQNRTSNGEGVEVGLDGTVTRSGSCVCDLTSEEDPLEITISWNDQTADFDLTPHYVDPLPLAGNGENWSFEYTPDDFGEEDRMVFTYIGEGEPPEEFNYQIGEGGTSGNGIWLTDGQYSSGGGCGACEVYNQSNEVEIKVDWNGKTESFRALTQQ